MEVVGGGYRYLLPSLGNDLRESIVFCQVLHGDGDPILAGLGVLVVFPDNKTSEVVVDPADGFSRADGGDGR